MEREELERLERRIDSLERELNLVKIQLMKAKHAANDAPTAVHQEKPQVKKPQVVSQTERPPDPSVEQTPKEAFDFSVERWLPKVFLFVLLIGSVWGSWRHLRMDG